MGFCPAFLRAIPMDAQVFSAFYLKKVLVLDNFSFVPYFRRRFMTKIQ